MKVNKELSHLKAHFLEGKAPKASSVRQNGFLPFTLGVNVGWIVSLFLWKLCVKHAEKSGLTVSEWIGQKIFSTAQAPASREMNSFVPQPLKTTDSQKAVIKDVLAEAESFESQEPKVDVKAQKAFPKKAKASSKKSVAKKVIKAEEKKPKEKASQKKTVKKAAKIEKTAKKTVTASKAKKKVKNSEDKT
ncbi:hypothetical protein FAI41_06570 [Acetobacteraceae bacterium]|nr:hypothetical protein FAI41_06570 [Acetobacteraceae bacterium]